MENGYKYENETEIREKIKNGEEINWFIRVSNTPGLTENFIRENKDKVRWSSISSHSILSEDFIREFEKEVSWLNIACRQKLSENFIREYVGKVNQFSSVIYRGKDHKFYFIRNILAYQSISEEFKKELSRSL